MGSSDSAGVFTCQIGFSSAIMDLVYVFQLGWKMFGPFTNQRGTISSSAFHKEGWAPAKKLLWSVTMCKMTHQGFVDIFSKTTSYASDFTFEFFITFFVTHLGPEWAQFSCEPRLSMFNISNTKPWPVFEIKRGSWGNFYLARNWLESNMIWQLVFQKS